MLVFSAALVSFHSRAQIFRLNLFSANWATVFSIGITAAFFASISFTVSRFVSELRIYYLAIFTAVFLIISFLHVIIMNFISDNSNYFKGKSIFIDGIITFDGLLVYGERFSIAAIWFLLAMLARWMCIWIQAKWLKFWQRR
jgi:ABC-type branched-subunit amino acid transport system permease subunit